MKKILFRCDASNEIGTGHVVRCLTLAQEMKKRGWICSFFTNKEANDFVPVLSESGFDIIKPTNDINFDVMVFDHYNISSKEESQFREKANNIVVLDDLADRLHDCDLLIDSTYGRREQDYASLVSAKTEILAGPDYALLRPEFAENRTSALERRTISQGRVDNILVMLSGTDPHNVTLKILSALKVSEATRGLTINLVLGTKAAQRMNIESLISGIDNIKLHTDVRNMASMMMDADLAIGAGGTASWERCCMGLPTILIEIAENQRTVSKNLYQAGAVYNMGWHQNLELTQIAKIIDEFISDPSRMLSMSTKAAEICDGKGAVRLANQIINLSAVTLRPFHESDAEIIYKWQTEAGARAHSRNKEPPSWDEHLIWLKSFLKNDLLKGYVILYNNNPAGFIRLAEQSYGTQEVSILIGTEFRGCSIAFSAISKIKSLYRDALLLAFIYPENSPSVSLFLKAGFQPQGGNWYKYEAKGTQL